MSGSSVVSLGFMIAAAVFLPFTGVALAVSVGVAGVAGGLLGNALFPPKTSAAALSQGDLSIMTATVGSVVPVVFGTCKLTANAMNWNEKFLKINIKKEKVGKGGKSVETGREYIMPYEQLLCMGPVETIEQVYTSPGYDPLLNSPISFVDGVDSLTFEINHQDKGGAIRIYKGVRQEREAAFDPYYTTGMNYNYKCWALMGASDLGGFKLGNSKTAPSYAWVVSRLPGRNIDGNSQGGGDPGPGLPAAGDLTNRFGVVFSKAKTTSWEQEGNPLSPSIIDTDITFFCDLKIQSIGGGKAFLSGWVSGGATINRSTPLNLGLVQGCSVSCEIYLQRKPISAPTWPTNYTSSILLAAPSALVNGANLSQEIYGERIQTLILDTNHEYRVSFIHKQTGQIGGDVGYSGASSLLDSGWDHSGRGDGEGSGTGGAGGGTPFSWSVEDFPSEGDPDDYAIYPRGSYDTGHIHYRSGNPAAILYECLTNPIWGLNRPEEEIDLKSFALASQYYAENNLGLSFVLSELTTFKEVLKLVQDHVKCQIVFEDGKIRLLNYLYTGEDINATPILSEDNTKSIEIQSPTWQGVYNRVTADYTDPSRKYKISQIDVRNESTQELQAGEERVMKINLSGFLDRNIAMRQAERVLAEVSKPTIVVKAIINRSVGIGLQVGDLVRLRWAQVAESGKVVIIPCRVTALRDNNSEEDDIVVELSENVDYARQLVGINERLEEDEGASDSFRIEDVPSATEYENELNVATPYSDVIVYEPNNHTANLLELTKKTIAILVPLSNLVEKSIPYSQLGVSGDPKELTEGPSEAYVSFGTLNQDMPLNYMDRSSDGILVTIPNSLHKTTVLSRYTKVNTGAENMEKLLEEPTRHLVLIGNELMSVGYVDLVDNDTNTFRLRNILRGSLGTKIQTHLTGDKIAFIPELSTDFITQVSENVVGNVYYYSAYPVSLQGNVIADSSTYLPQYPVDVLYGNQNAYLNLQSRPSCPELYFTENLTTTSRKVWVRPRLTGQGAGYGNFVDSLNTVETNNLQIVYDEIRYVGGVPQFVKRNLSFGNYIPTVDGDPATGIFKKEAFTVSGTTTHIRIRAFKDNLHSIDYIEVAVV